MKTIKFEQYEISLIKELIAKQIEEINSGIVSYGSKQDNMEYERDYQSILDKLL